ncbi:hypothetical protein HMPREF9969_1611 [Prevotella sp. oral taxon 306 str. F0472]|nr:hypothetical protein HMPREF9969_1611 [Prevotella sp. oral taxon 306 str. F0472]
MRRAFLHYEESLSLIEGKALFVGKKALVVFLFSSSWIGIVP